MQLKWNTAIRSLQCKVAKSFILMFMVTPLDTTCLPWPQLKTTHTTAGYLHAGSSYRTMHAATPQNLLRSCQRSVAKCLKGRCGLIFAQIAMPKSDWASRERDWKFLKQWRSHKVIQSIQRICHWHSSAWYLRYTPRLRVTMCWQIKVKTEHSVTSLMVLKLQPIVSTNNIITLTDTN